MNEQRQQAYLNLIQRLLNCRSHDEVREILAANQELVDVGFFQKTSERVSNLIVIGEFEQANRLMNIVRRLLEVYSDSVSDITAQEEYVDFLTEVLQAINSSWGNVPIAQVVYPLLANNTDKLDEVLAEILRQWGTYRLREATADQEKYQVAVVIVVLSNIISKFPLGNKASNMEIAITGYEVVLTFFTQQAFPEDWAATQNNLGEAYRNRIRGDKADNLERAIACYQEALKVKTFEAFPQDWAGMQHNLGTAFSDRIRGDKADNLEQAIACYQEALRVRTFEDFPQNWAETQHNLGTAYSDRILGEKAQNLEQAIACYQEALK
ncbi:tetratricopeptide repeat-containing protein [Nostoc sp. CHAB 5715]|nr:tetratricopeptide repeat-containing protein [Nostoc sp. CHAB 5715]